MLTRSKPMKRSGFKRPACSAPSASPAVPLPRDVAERIRTGPAVLNVAIKPAQPVRSEKYRRLVVRLPCIYCGIQGYSQCAHANQHKGAGTKVDDRMTFPLCADRPGVVGCHALFDQGALFTKQARREVEAEWARRTRMQIEDAGEWPAELERLDDEHVAQVS